MQTYPVAAVVLAMLCGSQALAQSNINATMNHEGLIRSYTVHLPPGFSAGAQHPLVVALHPSFSTGPDFQATSGWDAVSDQSGIVVVYPTGGVPVGTNGKFAWNSYDFTGAPPNDLSFLAALVTRVQLDYGTAACRTYMTGFSNGAMMTNSFAAYRPDLVAAIAPVSGGWITAYGGSESEISPAPPMPVWIWRGSNENFTTGTGANARPRSQQDQEQLGFWVANNEATFESTVTEQLTYGTTRTYVTSKYTGTAPVWFTEVQGSSHVYQPGAADLVWNRFFAKIVSDATGCTTGIAFCFGDGAGVQCPCGNTGLTGGGCGNSINAQGGRLVATGAASIANDTFVLRASRLPNSSALYFQGTDRANNGFGTVFGDGLRCVQGTVIRLGTKVNAAGGSSYPVSGDQSISVRGAITQSGSGRYYQVWYRNAASFCTASTFNLTNGVQVTWTP
jgi:polyhydroxybutyrate depolymerase